MQELLRIFDLHDAKHVGVITKLEVIHVLRSSGINILLPREMEALILNAGAGAEDMMMTRDQFIKMVQDNKLDVPASSGLIAKESLSSGEMTKAEKDVLFALKAFDYKERGYLTLGEVTSILSTVIEKPSSSSAALAHSVASTTPGFGLSNKLSSTEKDTVLKGLKWQEGDGTSSSNKVLLETLAKHLSRHYSQLTPSQSEAMDIVASIQ